MDEAPTTDPNIENLDLTNLFQEINLAETKHWHRPIASTPTLTGLPTATGSALYARV